MNKDLVILSSDDGTVVSSCRLRLLLHLTSHSQLHRLQASNGKIVVNDELGRIWKESGVSLTCRP
jgi:hypothetical protein